jgi:hypothetical protein
VGDIAGSLAMRNPGLASSARVPISRSSHLLASDGTTVSALAIAHWHTPFTGQRDAPLPRTRARAPACVASLCRCKFAVAQVPGVTLLSSRLGVTVELAYGGCWSPPRCGWRVCGQIWGSYRLRVFVAEP